MGTAVVPALIALLSVSLTSALFYVVVYRDKKGREGYDNHVYTNNVDNIKAFPDGLNPEVEPARDPSLPHFPTDAVPKAPSYVTQTVVVYSPSVYCTGASRVKSYPAKSVSTMTT